MSDPASVRVELAELRRKLASLESLRDVLGDEAVEKARADLEARMRALVGTGGGALVLGDVDVTDGDFVGRDKWQLWVERLYLGQPPDRVPPEVLLQAYLRALAAECRRLPLGVVDPRFLHAGPETPVPLSEVYVDLDVLAPAREELEKGERPLVGRLLRGEGGERTPLRSRLGQDHLRPLPGLRPGNCGRGERPLVPAARRFASTGNDPGAAGAAGGSRPLHPAGGKGGGAHVVGRPAG